MMGVDVYAKLKDSKVETLAQFAGVSVQRMELFLELEERWHEAFMEELQHRTVEADERASALYAALRGLHIPFSTMKIDEGWQCECGRVDRTRSYFNPEYPCGDVPRFDWEHQLPKGLDLSVVESVHYG